MKNWIIAAFVNLLISIQIPVFACTMYKITENGKTIVGNNEDYLSPNSQFWYETPSAGKFGVMYMGQLNNFAQGAINDQGLMFDGFSTPYLAVNNSSGKTKINIGEVIKKIMQTMRTVEEVKSYFATIDLSSLTNSMVVFVDKSGSYLIVEGDELIIGNESEKSFSNFYYSQTKNLDDVKLEYFQKGQKFLNGKKKKSTLDFCGEAMDNFAQKNFLNATQYSTIYDLNSLKIRVYLYHDYSEFIEIDLKKQLKKGNHKTMIAELFPKESIGYQYYQKYNDAENPAAFIAEKMEGQDFTVAELEEGDFADDLNVIGYEWLKDKKNPKAAIKFFEYSVSLMPNNYDLYDSLGEAYLEDNDYVNSIKNYAKSLALNPKNENAVEMIVVCREKLDAQSDNP